MALVHKTAGYFPQTQLFLQNFEFFHKQQFPFKNDNSSTQTEAEPYSQMDKIIINCKWSEKWSHKDGILIHISHFYNHRLDKQ